LVTVLFTEEEEATWHGEKDETSTNLPCTQDAQVAPWRMDGVYCWL